MAGFSHDIAGGDGVLKIIVFQSPNYVAGTSGWAVFKDGSAEFNDVTIRGGEVIDGTALYYSGTPAAGSLVASVSASAGTDRFGNAYLAGVVSYQLGTSPCIAVEMTTSDVRWYTAATFAGPWDEAASIQLVTGTNDGLSIGPVSPAGYVQLAGNILSSDGSASSPTEITTDTLQTAGNANSWTGTLTYQLMPDKTVKWDGVLVPPAGVTNPSNVNMAVGTAYRPSSGVRQLTAVADTNASHVGAALICQMQASGVIQVFAATAGQAVHFSGSYSL